MKIIKPNILKELDMVEDLLPLISQSKADENDISAKHVKEVSLNDTDISEICFKGIIFENCKFVDCSFQKSDFIDVIFKSCDLSNSNLSDGYFNRCQFISSKAIGVNIQNGNLQHLSILNSNFKYANLLEIIKKYSKDFVVQGKEYIEKAKGEQVFSKFT